MPWIDKENYLSNYNNLKRKYNKSNWKRKKEKFLWREEPSEKRRFKLSSSLLYQNHFPSPSIVSR